MTDLFLTARLLKEECPRRKLASARFLLGHSSSVDNDFSSGKPFRGDFDQIHWENGCSEKTHWENAAQSHIVAHKTQICLSSISIIESQHSQLRAPGNAQYQLLKALPTKHFRQQNHASRTLEHDLPQD
jgi:hypothetical protein